MGTGLNKSAAQPCHHHAPCFGAPARSGQYCERLSSIENMEPKTDDLLSMTARFCLLHIA